MTHPDTTETKDIPLGVFQPKSLLTQPEGKPRPVGIVVHSMTEFRWMLEDAGLRPESLAMPSGSCFQGMPVHADSKRIKPGSFRFMYKDEDPMPDNEPTTERNFPEANPPLAEKGPVRILQADDGWYWVSRLEFESPMVGPFTSFGLAVTNAVEHGYTYRQPDTQPATKNSSAPLNPPEQNEAEPLPCPHCMTVPRRDAARRDAVTSWVECHKCGAAGPRVPIPVDLEIRKRYPCDEYTFSAWNKRAG